VTIHLVKLCVGVDSISDLEDRIARIRRSKGKGASAQHEHVTRMRPKRSDDLLNGGSLYWVIKGMILARQKILALEPRRGEDGVARTAIVMESKLILTEASKRRAFQGWRYLEIEDAPKDLLSRN